MILRLNIEFVFIEECMYRAVCRVPAGLSILYALATIYTYIGLVEAQAWAWPRWTCRYAAARSVDSCGGGRSLKQLLLLGAGVLRGNFPAASLGLS